MPLPHTESTTVALSTDMQCLGDPRWLQINLDDGEISVRAQIQNLIRYGHRPWTSVTLISPLVETMVLDVLQQELDSVACSDGYRTACMKCLRALSKARNIVPSSFFSRDVTREGTNPIGGGGFSDIWSGRLHNTRVCLKVLRIFVSRKTRERILKDFCQEALVWRQLRHPNILPFLGVSEDLFSPSYCLISPWMANGNIIHYLEVHPHHDRLVSLVQVAEGMKYLHNHNPPIVHADIRGANILVMDNLCCCLADFGLSLFAESQTLDSSGRMKGSIRWLAPEYLDSTLFDQSYLTARDIYAYGCTIVEIFTGWPPFINIKSEAGVIVEVLAKRNCLQRLSSNVFPDEELWSLVKGCLDPLSSQRPNAQKISEVLVGVQAASGPTIPPPTTPAPALENVQVPLTLSRQVRKEKLNHPLPPTQGSVLPFYQPAKVHQHLSHLAEQQFTKKGDTASSVQLQYQMELEKSGMIHNPKSGMCASDCLEMLKKREEAWTKFEPVFKRRIHVDHQETGIYEISGGTYFLGESKSTSIPFLRLPSTPDGDAEWDKLVVGCKIIDIGIALHEHDLFTAIVLDPSPHLKVKLYRLSTKSPHPLAANHIIPVHSCAVGKLSVGVEIVGDHLVLVTREHLLVLPDKVYIFNWKKGTLLHVIAAPNQCYTSFVFLNPMTLLLPNARNATLEIWEIPEGRMRTVLHLPRLKIGMDISHMACHGSPNPHSISTSRPFHPDPAESLLIFHLHIDGFVGTSTVVFLVHRKALLDLHRQGDIRVEWDAWGPPCTRWFPIELIHWIPMTTGHRNVLCTRRDIFLLDFNPWSLRRARVSKEGSGQVVDSDSDMPAILRMDLPLFMEPVVGNLPFVMRSMRHRNVHGVLVDEERILVLIRDDRGITDLDVMYFG